jgi:hypothetical protein
MADSFSLDVKKFSESFIEGAEHAVRGSAIKLFGEVIRSTPVDEGRARANWFATGQQPSVKLTNQEDLSRNGDDTAFAVATAVDKLKDWSVITLTNNLPYINKLEFGGYGDGPKTTNGYSKQAPAGMVRVNISRYNFILEQEAKKVLPK